MPTALLPTNAPIPPRRKRLRLAALLAGLAAVHFSGAAANAKIVVEANTLTIAGSGVLNIRNNALIVRLGDYATIYNYVLNGFNGGTWDGLGGINSSTAAADPTHLSAVGILDNAEAHYTTWEGRLLPGGAEILVEYTYIGDANLDGSLDQADLDLFGTGSGWYHGDFNYDGAVNATDLALFYSTRQALTGEAPEPGALSLLAAGVAVLSQRRGRRAV